MRDPFTLLEQLHGRLGPVVSLRLLGMGEWVFVSDPDLIKTLFKAPPDVLLAGEVNRRQLGFLLGEDATFCLDGAAHDLRRRVVLPYLNGVRAKARAAEISHHARLAIDALPSGSLLEVQPWAHRLALRILVRSLFGASDEAALDQLEEEFDTFSRRGLRSILLMMPWLQRDLGPRSPWGKILAMRAGVVATVRARVRERLEHPESFSGDVAADLAADRTRDGRALGEDALVDELINVLFAGHETTGNLLAWGIECVYRRPAVLQRVRSELARVTGGEPLETRHLPLLPYLDAVLEETFRFRPIAPMAGLRLVAQPFELGGYRLRQGSIVTQAFPVLGHSPDLYAEPSRFDPSHFFERKLPPYHWNPFGGGRRQCLGKGLAQVELAVLLGETARSVDLELAQETVELERDGIFFSPSQGLRMRVLGHREWETAAPPLDVDERSGQSTPDPAGGCPFSAPS